MQSSRMRIVRCSSRLPGGGVSAWPGGVSPWGVYTSPLPLWTKFLTHACENITFLQLRLRTVKRRTPPPTTMSKFSMRIFNSEEGIL